MLNMHSHTQTDVSLHIQALSLVHGMSVSTELAQQIAEHFKCDVRKILNFLHTHLHGHYSPVTPSFNQPRFLSTRQGPQPREESESQSALTELRTKACLADTIASIDILSSDRNSPFHLSPWWRKRPVDSLVDEPSECYSTTSPPCDIPDQLSELFLRHSHPIRYIKINDSTVSKSWYFDDEPYPLSRYTKEEDISRTKELHSAQMNCAVAIFSPHLWTLSHVAMVMEGLPCVRLICDAEDVRESINTSRRG